MTAAAQLALRFARAPVFAAAELLPNAAQSEACAWLDASRDWPSGRLALWGEPGSGKSHLAHVWAARHGGVVLPSAPADPWPSCPVAIDAIDAVPDEPALLHLLNAATGTGQPVLLVARVAPGRLPVRLPDLASRLRATAAVRIDPADDAFLALLLGRLLAERQIRVAEPVQSWLLARLPRTPAAIRDAVAQLDAAALTAGRAITRNLARTVLALDDNLAANEPVRSPATPGPG